MKSLTETDRNNLYKAVLTLKSETECQKFLRDLLTESEINEFANRWKVARMLNEKYPYKEIEETTGMSSTTIARISKWLTEGTGGYRLVLKRLFPKTSNHHHIKPGAV